MDNNSNKIIYIFLAIAVTMFLIVGGTLAYWSWQSAAAQNTAISFTLTSGLSCSADGGGSITSNDVKLAPAKCTNTEHAIQRTITTSVTNSNEGSAYMSLSLKVNSMASELAASENFKYALTTDPSSCTTDVKETGTFTGATENSTFTILDGEEYPTSPGTGTYYLYIWLDEAESNNNTQNKTFNLSLTGVCTNKKPVILHLGDYVSYTPIKTSYTTDTSMTGHTSTQTINPSELNLWRVISLNGNGTVDIISEHVSSTSVYFRGQTGYQNLVGYLNVLAKQYETTGVTAGSRYFGYNGQTEYITDTTYFVNSAPWTCNTGSTYCNPKPQDYEGYGGGDTLYQSDYDLINTVLGTRVVTTPSSGAATYYWMASRYYSYNSSTSYYWNGRSVNASGSRGSNNLYGYSSSSFNTYSFSYALRPIVTLKPGLSYSGTGTASDPWTIE